MLELVKNTTLTMPIPRAILPGESLKLKVAEFGSPIVYELRNVSKFGNGRYRIWKRFRIPKFPEHLKNQREMLVSIVLFINDGYIWIK